MLITKSEVIEALGQTGTITAANDRLLSLVHPLAESVLKVWLEQNFEYQQRVELYPIGQESTPDVDLAVAQFQVSGERVVISGGPSGSTVLHLKHLPVWAASLEIREDVGAYAGQATSAFGTDTTLTAGEDYYLDIDDFTNQLSSSGIVHRIGAWPTEPRSIKVTYYGGFKSGQFTTEKAGVIRYAALLTVLKAYRQMKALQKHDGPVTSETIGKYSWSTSAEIAAAMSVGGFTVPPEATRALSKLRNFGRLFG